MAELTRIFLIFVQDRGQIFEHVFGRFGGGSGGVLAGFGKVFRCICPENFPAKFQEKSGTNPEFVFCFSSREFS